MIYFMEIVAVRNEKADVLELENGKDFIVPCITLAIKSHYVFIINPEDNINLLPSLV